jgi:peroxiredoxin
MWPHERSLVAKYRDRPFALIGVNLNGYAPDELKESMEKHGLTWRCFADPGDLGRGAIAASWNFPGTPTLYIIDAQGIIRRKWTGQPSETIMDRVLEALIEEAERERGYEKR